MKSLLKFFRYYGRRSPTIFLIGFPMALVLIIQRAFFDVRLICIPNRLGHTISSLDHFLTTTYSTSVSQNSVKKNRNIFFLDRKYLDDEIYDLVSRLVRLRSNLIWSPTYEAVLWLGLESVLTTKLVVDSMVEESRVFSGAPVLKAALSSSSEKRVSNMIDQLGIQLDRLVLLCIRDSAYGKSIQFAQGETVAGYRNSTITNYLRAISTFVQNGYFVVRMGNFHEGEYPNLIPGFSSYPKLNKSFSVEQIDLFMNCAFVISSDTGLNKLAIMARKNTYMLNLGSLNDRFLHGLTPLVIYKKFYSIINRQSLTLADIIEFGAHKFSDSRDFAASGIYLEENPSDYIYNFAVEVIQKHENIWLQSEESKFLTQQFKSTLKAATNLEIGNFVFPNFYSKDVKW